MIVVTGATGNVGRPLTDLLLQRGHSVRALSRQPNRADLPANVELHTGDVTVRESLTGLFDGAQSAFMVVHVPGPPGQMENLLDEARAAGLRHIVVLSSLSVERIIPGDPVGEGHREIEQQIAQSGIAATLLRPGTFHSNTLAWADQIAQGDVVTGMAYAAAASIDPRDIAEAAALALIDAASVPSVISLTGPEPIDTAGQVAAVGEAIGRELVFHPLPEAAVHEWIRSSGSPADPAALVESVAGKHVPWAEPRDDFQRLLGRAPRGFKAWAIENRSKFTSQPK